MEEKQITRTHRVGTITFGLGLVLFGSLFLIHLFVPVLDYRIIFHLWPCLLILLGIEVLVANSCHTKDFLYDKTAIVLIVVLSLFTMIMGGADWIMQTYSHYAALYW